MKIFSILSFVSFSCVIFAAVNEDERELEVAQSLAELNKNFIDQMVHQVLCDDILSKPVIEFKVSSNDEFGSFANQLIQEFSVEHKNVSYILEKATLANYKKQVVEVREIIKKVIW